jgi:hypothetical protein
MRIHTSVIAGAALCAVLWNARGADAALVADSSGKTVYDTVANRTWLADANLAVKKKFGISGIHPDGSMSWTTAHSWVVAMNAAHYLGSNHWDLPGTALPDGTCSQKPSSAAFGFNCTGSEMGALFYKQLGGAQGNTIQLRHNAGYRLFNNFQPYLYWSSKLWTVPNSAFSFSFGNGFQGTNVFVNDLYAIATAPGKVGSFKTHPSPKPTPRHFPAPKCPPGVKCPKPI